MSSKLTATFKVILIAAIVTVGTISGIYVYTQASHKPVSSPSASPVPTGSRTDSVVVRVACVGDSITEGTEYPSDLAAMLGSNYTVGNFGVGGTTVTLASEAGYMNQTQFEDAKKFNPDIVVILLGTNDAYPEREQYLGYFMSDYQRLIEAFQALPTNPKIYLVLPPPIFSDDMGPSNTVLVQNVIPLIKQVANETGLPLVDANTPLLEHSDYFWDGVHPNRYGARILASQVYDAIVAGKGL